jgi:PKD repeat protein
MKKLLLLITMIGLGSLAAHAQCNANFTYIQSTPGTVPMVYFINQSSGDSTGAGISYMWDFGDGQMDVTHSPGHTYPSFGTYNVCLSLSDNSGCHDTICMAVTLVAPPATLQVYFITDSMSMYACTSPTTVLFYYGGSASGFAPNTAFDVHMVWGDGTDSMFQFIDTAFGGTVTHAYANAGNYTPQMTVTDANNTVSQSQTGMSVMVAATCGPITGHVYNDVNNNCMFDAGEELANIPLTIYLTGGQMVAWTQTDATGTYSFNVPTGNSYDIHVQTNNGWMGSQLPSCPASGTLTVPTIPSTGN